jgi:hydroxymethylpyrimidine pyrophosphatase-like HAD family hydrolase
MSDNLKNLKNLIAMFFSENLRSRRTSIGRAAEIARRVLELLPKFDSEGQVLSGLWEIEKDFVEIGELRHALHFGYNPSEIIVYEKEVKEYAADVFKNNMAKSVAFLQDAAKPTMSIQELCIRYPQFCEFLVNKTEKGEIIQGLRQQLA